MTGEIPASPEGRRVSNKLRTRIIALAETSFALMTSVYLEAIRRSADEAIDSWMRGCSVIIRAFVRDKFEEPNSFQYIFPKVREREREREP
jgi:hypothetical protein